MIERIENIVSQVFVDEEKHSDIMSKMNEIPELKKHGEMVDEIAISAFDFVRAYCDLESKIQQDREKLFSKEYMDKMAQLADEGVFLYFLETPDMPLLDEELTAQKIIDLFYHSNCFSLQTLFYNIMQLRDASPSMKRKTDDIDICFQLLIFGYSHCQNNNGAYYRSVARNMFALLDAEHKKCANVFEGFFEKKKTFRNGLQRSLKIQQLVNNLNVQWENTVWEKINEYYRKITIKDKQDGVIHRNSIIHGDYESENIDVSSNDAMKLMLLWINMRLLADKLSYMNEIMEIFLTYLPAIIKQNIDGK